MDCKVDNNRLVGKYLKHNYSPLTNTHSFQVNILRRCHPHINIHLHVIVAMNFSQVNILQRCHPHINIHLYVIVAMNFRKFLP